MRKHKGRTTLGHGEDEYENHCQENNLKSCMQSREMVSMQEILLYMVTNHNNA